MAQGKQEHNHDERQLAMFDAPPPEVRGMARNPDRPTSIEAAKSVLSTRARVKAMVFQAFKDHGPLTDAELGRLPEFQGIAYTSVSKRRTDLVVEGRLEATGERRGHPDRPNSKLMVWALAEVGE
ncbi:MAG: hypothetical protein H0W63_04045 [Gemmatimonadaceae bacterium]|nr:hypothetical protein [Gemmatimonadaceae bacterium]